jgi:GNAT superfamily N-acetyltransferase
VKVALSAPEPIGTNHQIRDFTRGVVSLDEWLKRRALANQASGAARTAAVCEADRVIGYYALASDSVTIAAAPGRFRRNMPEPIPVVVVARLADDRAYHGRGLGRALVRDAARRAVHRASDDWAAGSANCATRGNTWHVAKRQKLADHRR